MSQCPECRALVGHHADCSQRVMTKLDRVLENYGWDDDAPLTMTGYDDCIVGVVQQFGRPPIICYDLKLVIAQLVRNGMTEDEAQEWWSYNQVGAWMGESTPCFIDTLEDE